VRPICLNLTEDQAATLWREDLVRVAGTAFSLPARLATRITYEPHTHCWRVCGSGKPDGHMQVSLFGETRQFSRVVWHLLRGPIPEQHSLMHSIQGGCYNPDCCNVWEHLEPLGPLDTLKRLAAQPRMLPRMRRVWVR